MVEGILPANGRFKNITGQVYGRLTVQRFVGTDQRHKAVWQCLCDCGVTIDVLGDSLRRGNTASCGCLYRETRGVIQRTHGRSGSTEFTIWRNMKNRCHKPGTVSYHNYGGRGIQVCQGWRNNFTAFFESMGARPSLKHTIERIDNHRGYQCGRCAECLENNWSLNCRWATWAEQSRNKRNNRLLTLNGETMCQRDWIKRLGIPKSRLERRLKAGWSVEDALTRPARITRASNAG